MGRLATVQLSDIRENEVALRTVNRESEDYLGLVDSIRQKGFLGAITVREKTDPETSQIYYELVDGLHRFKAACDAGLTEIGVDIVDLDDSETLEAQLMANVHKIETRPIEYTQQLKKILNLQPLMTEAELAESLGKSPQWIKQRLGLLKIENKDIQQLIDEGKIGLANAYALAKLPPEEMADFVDRAMTMPPDTFVPAVNERAKEIREAKRKGQDAGEAEFQPRAFLQKMADIKKVHTDGEMAQSLCAANKIKTPVEGFALAVAWVLHLDPESVAAQKQQDEERKQQRAEAKKRREVEKAAKKAETAKKKAAEAAVEAEKAKASLS
jgi:ParB/RepB/Spo0J family partition protein